MATLDATTPLTVWLYEIERAGAGAVTLHASHGFGANAYSWGDALERLAPGLRRTIAHDHPGFGLCGNQRFEAAPFRGELMLFRRHFLDARRGGAERIRLVQAGAESVTTRPT